MSALRKAKWSFTSPKDRHFLCISHNWLHVETQLLELPPRDACLLENGKAIQTGLSIKRNLDSRG